MLGDSAFLEVIDRAPLVSIDLVVVDPGHRVLCGVRVNEPARGYWFVPGGRIFKGETLDGAFRRIALTELGPGEWRRAEAGLLGVFEHIYDGNYAGAAEISTHYVVLAYRLDVSVRPDPPAAQHSQYAWLDRPADRTGPDGIPVHEYTAAYFELL